jgi:hypothetical protein
VGAFLGMVFVAVFFTVFAAPISPRLRAQ